MEKAKDVIVDLEMVAIEVVDHTWSLRMPISAPEGREQAVALDKGTVASEIHVAATGKR